MNSKFHLSLGIITLLTTTSFSHAQRELPGTGTSPIKVGSDLADVTAYLEDGTAYRLRDNIEGKHTVLVFGCLT